MLTPEQAREALNQVRDPGWKKKALRAVEALAEPARPIDRVLLDRDLAGQEDKDRDWDERLRLHAEAARRLGVATTSDRMNL
jgi:hypothetical protein